MEKSFLDLYLGLWCAVAKLAIEVIWFLCLLLNLREERRVDPVWNFNFRSLKSLHMFPRLGGDYLTILCWDPQSKLGSHKSEDGCSLHIQSSSCWKILENSPGFHFYVPISDIFKTILKKKKKTRGECWANIPQDMCKSMKISRLKANHQSLVTQMFLQIETFCCSWNSYKSSILGSNIKCRSLD